MGICAEVYVNKKFVIYLHRYSPRAIAGMLTDNKMPSLLVLINGIQLWFEGCLKSKNIKAILYFRRNLR